MNIVASLEDSTRIWLSASKRYARKKTDTPFDGLLNVPSVSKLIVNTTKLPRDFAPSISNAQLAEAGARLGLTRPLHVGVFNKEQRRHGGAQASELFPSGMEEMNFSLLEDGIYICPPEACFLYMCRRLSFDQAVLLGTELCGRYVLDPDIEGGIGKRPTLSSPADLQAFLDCMGRVDGVTRFRQVMPWILGESESPRESMLGICHELPRSRGGYGLHKPKLNHVVILSKHAARAYGRATCRCDEYFEECRLAIEYESSAYHKGEEARMKDARRTAALALHDIEVIPVTSQQTDSLTHMDTVAQLIAERMGLPTRCRVADYDLRKAALQENLLARCDWAI